MSEKYILIIEPDEFVSSIIQKSFIGYDPNINIEVLTDPALAADRTSQGEFNVILTDAEYLLDNPNLLSRFLEVDPKTIHTILTGYNSLPEDFPLSDKENYHFLQKPIDSRQLFSIIEKIFGPIRNKDLGHFSLSRQQYAKCNEELIKLRNNVSARCIMLSDPVGRVLISTGSIEGIASDTITSLLGGGLATLLEAGKELDQESVLNLSYREGRNTDLYALNIGKILILILIIDKGRFYNKLGTVWYYARQAALNLESGIADNTDKPDQQVFNNVNNETISDEIDRLINF